MANLRRNPLLALLWAAAVIAAVAMSRARAEPQPAFDRTLVERLVRAQEAQVRAQETQLRAQEAEVRALESLVRATEKCRP